MISRPLIIGAVVMLAVALGMGSYVWHMRGVSRAELAETTPRSVAPPVSGPTEQVTLYVAYDDVGILRAQPSRIPLPQDRQQRRRRLVRLGPHPVS